MTDERKSFASVPWLSQIFGLVALVFAATMSENNGRGEESDSTEFSSSSSSSSDGEGDTDEDAEEEENQLPRQQAEPQLHQTTPHDDQEEEGLTDTEKLQLVTDIVEAGGLDNIGLQKHPLARLLVDKADHYALHLPEKKRQIQNKVNHWKSSRKGRNEYDSFVRSSLPSPSRNRRSSKTPPGSKVKTSSRTTPNSNSSRKTPNSSRKTPDSSRRKKQDTSSPCETPIVQRTTYRSPEELTQHASYRSPEELHFERPRQEYVRPFDPEPSTLPMTSYHRTLLNGAGLINTNTNCPEKNGTVMVYHFENLLESTVLRNGYILEIQYVDRRWMEELETEAIEAWQVAPNEVLVKQPSTSFSFLHATDEETKGKALANFDNAVIEQATSVPRNAIIADESRQFVYTRFVFPEDLDNSVFSPNADKGKITPKLVPLVTELTYSGPDTNGDHVEVEYEAVLNVNVNFTICKLEKDKRLVETKKKVNALREQLEGMNVATGR